MRFVWKELVPQVASPGFSHYEVIDVPQWRNRYDGKALRPERCVVWDGQPCPCAACTEDIELKKKKIERLERLIEKEKIHIKALCASYG
jgi:hypothetical protein